MLNLDDLVSVTVSLSGLPAAREGFGAACLAGASGKLPSGTRTRVYSSAGHMRTSIMRAPRAICQGARARRSVPEAPSTRRRRSSIGGPV